MKVAIEVVQRTIAARKAIYAGRTAGCRRVSQKLDNAATSSIRKKDRRQA